MFCASVIPCVFGLAASSSSGAVVAFAILEFAILVAYVYLNSNKQYILTHELLVAEDIFKKLFYCIFFREGDRVKEGGGDGSPRRVRASRSLRRYSIQASNKKTRFACQDVPFDRLPAVDVAGEREGGVDIYACSCVIDALHDI